ncbi:MAG: 50S ribosomal protein L15 [bacterium]
MSLSKLVKIKDREKKRVGRGMGSGKGSHTSGRGQKGQTSRSGNQIRAGFEGGQNRIVRRLPKLKGIRTSKQADSKFMSPKKRTKVQVSLNFLNKFNEGDIVTENMILEMKGVKGLVYIKVIDSGELVKKITIDSIKVTDGAKQKIEKLGGKVL